MTHEEYVKTIKSSMAVVITKAAMISIISKVPLLGSSYLSPAVSWVLSKLVEFILNQTETMIFLGYIDMRVNKQADEYIAAANHNFKIQQNGTPEEKRKAEEVLFEKFKAFARFSN